MESTHGQAFFEDPLLGESIEKILQLLSRYQEKILGVAHPKKTNLESYESAIQRLSEIRGTPLYFPYLGSGIGKGPLVELLDGSIKYDMINGIGPYYFGHSHHRLIKSCILGALSDTVMQGNLEQNKIALDVMEGFKKLSGLDHCFLTSSGAMALENGIKIAYQHRKGVPRVLAFEGCFSGRTLTLSQITDKPLYREGIPPFLQVDYLPFRENQGPEESLKQLEIYLKRYPGQHAFFLIELIQGEGGFRVGTKDYFLPLLERAKKEGIVILFDEVQTFGRLEKPFAFQTLGLEAFADIVTIGKLSNICATLYKSSLKPKSGLLSQTFTGSTTALFAADETLKLFKEENIFGDNGKNAQVFRWCEKEIKRLPLKGPYGRGSMVAFSVGDGSEETTKKFLQELFKRGVIAFSAGSNPTKVRMLLPAPILEESDIKKVFEIVEETLHVLSP